MDNGCKIWRKRVPHNIRLPAAIASLAYSLVASQVMVQMCDGPFLWPHIDSLQPNRTMSLSSRGSICPSLVELACNMDAGHHCGERLCELFRGSQRDIPTDRTHTPGRGWCPSFFQADAQWPHSLLHAVKIYGGMSPKWARSVSLHVKISLLCISSQGTIPGHEWSGPPCPRLGGGPTSRSTKFGGGPTSRFHFQIAIIYWCRRRCMEDSLVCLWRKWFIELAGGEHRTPRFTRPAPSTNQQCLVLCRYFGAFTDKGPKVPVLLANGCAISNNLRINKFAAVKEKGRTADWATLPVAKCWMVAAFSIGLHP